MVVQHLSTNSLKAYIRYFTLLLQVNDNDNIKAFLKQCEDELNKRQQT